MRGRVRAGGKGIETERREEGGRKWRRVSESQCQKTCKEKGVVRERGERKEERRESRETHIESEIERHTDSQTEIQSVR